MKNNLFLNVSTLTSGIDDISLTFGAAWGDFNGDGYLDLWVNNHNDPSSLYLNQKDGTFRDITTETFAAFPGGDEHGTAWVDYDNDGDLDLINLVGARRGVGVGSEFSNRFYVNEGGILEERAVSLGIDYPIARGRSPVWLDYNNDGRLDLIVGAIPRLDGVQAPAKIFLQGNDGKFTDASDSTGLTLDTAQFFVLSDLSGDGTLDLITSKSSSVVVYNTTSLPFQNITSKILPSKTSAEDIVSADFNGDLKPDLFLAKNSAVPNEFFQQDIDSLVARLFVQESETGIKFTTDGKVNFNILNTDGPLSIPLDRIYIGKTGKNLADFGFDFADSKNLDFTLSPDNPNVRGIYPHIPGQDTGIYIGYNDSLQSWQLLLSSNANSQSSPQKNSLLAFIDAVKPISQSKSIGFDSETLPSQSQLLLSSNSGLVDRSLKSGINDILAQHQSAVAGDFDNDMDEDLFIVTTTEINNTSDILYENQGDGTFVAVPKAGGAKGMNLGTGNFVVTADYDLNGFLDLLVANVGEETPSPLINNNSYELFQNQGNGNHWLEIDLQGLVSNRDGLGAQIFLTAGGKTQMRQQNGGMHDDVQNSQRIHFGLAKNTIVDELKILWPSGREQIITNITVDRLIRVIESGGKENETIIGSDFDDFLNGKSGKDILRGGEGNDQLRGYRGSDTLNGGSGDDVLFGGEGSDILIGNNGNDILAGGMGKDTFYFESFDQKTDTIGDFMIANDKIQVLATNFGGGLTAGSPIKASQFELGTIATKANQRFIYNPTNGGLFFDRDGSDSAFTQVRLANLNPGLGLTNNDIFAI